jgi:periplasmic protein TonB
MRASLSVALLMARGSGAQMPPPLLAQPAERPLAILSDEQIRKATISTPKPDYPIVARQRHLTGKGVYQLTISEYTGEVLSVDVLSSAGYPILDRAAVKTLKLWKFRPHAVTRAKVPITFSMPEHTAVR